jgi:phosphohistidine phosphatase
MRRLDLLRHAKSSWDDPGLADRDRPLAPRGERAATAMASHLAGDGVRYDLVLCSSARRTRQTLERMAPVLGDSEVSFEDELYAASADELLARLQRLPDPTDAVLLVAHNPGLQDLIAELASDGTDLDRVLAKFPTCALVTLAFDGPWRELAAGRATLVRCVTPRDLR